LQGYYKCRTIEVNGHYRKDLGKKRDFGRIGGFDGLFAALRAFFENQGLPCRKEGEFFKSVALFACS